MKLSPKHIVYFFMVVTVSLFLVGILPGKDNSNKSYSNKYLITLPFNGKRSRFPFAVDRNGNIYISQAFQKKILKFSQNGNLLLTINDKYLERNIQFRRGRKGPIGTSIVIAVDDYNQLLYVRIRVSAVLDNWDKVLRYSHDGLYKDTIFDSLNMLIDGSEYNVKHFIGVDLEGNFWIKLERNMGSPGKKGTPYIDVKITPTGEMIKVHSYQTYKFNNDHHIVALDKQGNFYVRDSYIRNIQDQKVIMEHRIKYSPAWQKLKEVVFQCPVDEKTGSRTKDILGIDSEGNYYLFESIKGRHILEKYNQDGDIIKSIKLPIYDERALISALVTQGGDVYIGIVEDEKWHIQKYHTTN